MKYRDITINFKMHAEKYEEIQCLCKDKKIIAREQHCPVKIMINEIVD